jgi:hypothetical protein
MPTSRPPGCHGERITVLGTDRVWTPGIPVAERGLHQGASSRAAWSAVRAASAGRVDLLASARDGSLIETAATLQVHRRGLAVIKQPPGNGVMVKLFSS